MVIRVNSTVNTCFATLWCLYFDYGYQLRLTVVRKLSVLIVPWKEASKFPVGAAVMNEKSVLFTGCNVENRYIGAGICAECVAISKALAAGSKKIKSIAIACVSAEVVAMPCGRCRQFIIEFGDVTVYPLKINGKDGTYEFEKNFKISDLLPDAFCPKSLKTAAAHPLSNVGATAKAPAKK
eukprot:Selendium_serpulae@DN5857_c1_g1_i1.p1